MKTQAVTLAKVKGHHTTFCSFSLKEDGIRVMAYGTHTNYTSSFLVQPEEAKEVYQAKMADGFEVIS